MSVMYRKSCVGRRQLYRRIENEKVKFKELIMSNSQEHNQVKKVKNNEIEQDYHKNEETMFDSAIDTGTACSDNEHTENQSSLVLSCDFKNAVNDIEDESTSYRISDIENESAPHSNLREQIKYWAIIKHSITHSALTDLLHILHDFHPELPLDSRTLLQTPIVINKKKLDTGEYCHIGLIKNLQYISQFYVGTTMELSFNIDGLPLFNSTNKHLWPILCLIKNMQMPPFVIGIFYGQSKPCPLHLYLKDFIEELSFLLKNGLEVNDRYFNIKIHSFICDAPARAYIKQIKNHNGYSCCEKCEEDGEYFEGRIILKGINAKKEQISHFFYNKMQTIILAFHLFFN